jgi:two-component system, LytTR family, response regulator
MSYSCIIIEDEPLAAERLKTYISKHRSLQLISSFESGKAGLDFLKKNEIDIVFLDLNLGEISGIHILENNNIPSQVIVTTAYQEYALKGFELDVVDYLLKPFVEERWLVSVEKAINRIEAKRAGNDRFVMIKTEHRLEKIFLRDILFIEGMGDYRRIHTAHKKIMTLQTFIEMEEMFAQSDIVRVHKSYMVAKSRIISISKDKLTLPDREIPISEKYRMQFTLP